MNRVWTSDDLRDLKAALAAGQTVQQLANVWKVSAKELEEFARDSGFLDTKKSRK